MFVVLQELNGLRHTLVHARAKHKQQHAQGYDRAAEPLGQQEKLESNSVLDI